MSEKQNKKIVLLLMTNMSAVLVIFQLMSLTTNLVVNVLIAFKLFREYLFLFYSKTLMNNRRLTVVPQIHF